MANRLIEIWELLTENCDLPKNLGFSLGSGEVYELETCVSISGMDRKAICFYDIIGFTDNLLFFSGGGE